MLQLKDLNTGLACLFVFITEICPNFPKFMCGPENEKKIFTFSLPVNEAWRLMTHCVLVGGSNAASN